MTYVDIIFILGAILLLVYIASVLTTDPKKKVSCEDSLIDSVYIPQHNRKNKK